MTQPPIRLRLGGYQPPDSIHNQAARRFGSELDARLGERIEFELIGNVLDIGRPSGDLPKMVASGELDACYISSVRFTESVPEFALLELPFVVRDRANAHRLLDGDYGARLGERMLATTEVRLLGLWDNGFRHLSNRVRPIRTPADCRGLAIRTQMSPLHGELFTALGFVPIAVDVKELVEQIAGPRFDAQDNPLTNIYNFGVHHHHRFITLTGHLFGATVMICNQRVFDGWPADVQQAVIDSARVATTLQRALAADEDALVLARLDPAENEVIVPTDADRAAFVEAVEPMLARHRAGIDPALLTALR
ncbi:MAG: TRAP transporter substrate-binding protein [Proteobacteria bacterium]|nr:TRAP transporter substrate-binding protein [Burkholderiales bacterium]